MIKMGKKYDKLKKITQQNTLITVGSLITKWLSYTYTKLERLFLQSEKIWK